MVSAEECLGLEIGRRFGQNCNPSPAGCQRDPAGGLPASPSIGWSLPSVNDLTITNPPRDRELPPYWNPSYPHRPHTAERAKWAAVLDEWRTKVAAATSKLDVLGNHPRRADFEYVAAQMQGALDQIADAGRRLPGVVGEMYAEDKHKVDQAVAALGRLLTKWDTIG
jgi:hypothetical protein